MARRTYPTQNTYYQFLYLHVKQTLCSVDGFSKINCYPIYISSLFFLLPILSSFVSYRHSFLHLMDDFFQNKLLAHLLQSSLLLSHVNIVFLYETVSSYFFPSLLIKSLATSVFFSYSIRERLGLVLPQQRSPVVVVASPTLLAGVRVRLMWGCNCIHVCVCFFVRASERHQARHAWGALLYTGAVPKADLPEPCALLPQHSLMPVIPLLFLFPACMHALPCQPPSTAYGLLWLYYNLWQCRSAWDPCSAK